MRQDTVVLRHTPGAPGVTPRELCGADELSVQDAGTGGALRLLERLAGNEPARGGVTELNPAQLPTADRDRLLAAVYRSTYGGRVESTVICPLCQARFDLDFQLDDLQGHLHQGETENAPAVPLGDGSFQLSANCRFRLPTGEDELAAAALPPEQAVELLLRRCILEGDPATDGEVVQQAMDQLAPVLQTELVARCPDCGHEQTLRFDVQSFLLTRIMQEQQQVAWEIHRLAMAYRWRYEELVSLPRSLRRRFVALIESE